MSRVIRITGALAAAILTAAPDALAQVTATARDSADSARRARQDSAAVAWRTAPRGRTADTASTAARADSVYIRQAIIGNTTEVRLGQVGKDRAESSEVEDFAERMGSQHDDMNDRWEALARSAKVGISLQHLRSAGGPTVERLEDLSGDAFDQAFMTEMIRRHEQDLAAFQRMSTAARSAEVRELAGDAVSDIEEHLTLARQVGSRVGVSTTAGRTDTTFRRRTTTGDTILDDYDGTTANDRRVPLRSEDRAFIQNVLQNHLMHLQLAERAKRQASRQETRRLAQRIEEDYKEWQERWVDVAERYDLNPPKGLGPLHAEKIERLERASKRNFDRTYAAIVAENMRSLLPYFRKEGQVVRPDRARRLVDEQLPLFRQILARAERLQTNARAEASERQ
jgi:putative membrane protein